MTAPSNQRRLSFLMKNGKDRGQRELEDEQRKIDDALASTVARRRATREEVPQVDRKEIEAFLEMFATLLGRPIALDRMGRDRHLSAIQRCRACRGEVTSRVPAIAAGDPVWQSELGHRIRHDYAAHQCEPVASALHGCTADELDAVLQTTELELLRVGARFKAIEAELARRAPEAP